MPAVGVSAPAVAEAAAGYALPPRPAAHRAARRVLRPRPREHGARAAVDAGPRPHRLAEQVLHAFRAGGSAYCPKDVPPGKLVQVIRQVVQGHFVVGDQVFDRDGLQAWLESNVEQAGRPYVDDTREAFSPLSPREMEILQFVTRGLSNKEIALSLGISHQTVKNHMTAILHKLKVEDRTQAAVYALRRGWVRLQD